MLYAILLGTQKECSYYINGFPISPAEMNFLVDKGANIQLLKNEVKATWSDAIFSTPIGIERKEDSN